MLYINIYCRSDRELCKEKEKDLKKRKRNLDKNEQDIVELKDKLKPLEEQNRAVSYSLLQSSNSYFIVFILVR